MSGAPIKLVFAVEKCYEKFVTRRKYGNFYIKYDSRDPIELKYEPRLKLNPYMLGRYKLHRSVSQGFSGRNNLYGPFYVLVNFIPV